MFGSILNPSQSSKKKQQQKKWLSVSFKPENFLPGLIIGFIVGMFLDLSKPTKLPRKTSPTKHQQHPQGLGSNADSDGELKMILVQHHMYKVCSLLKFDKVLSKQAMEFDFSHQSINLRGLDGIQGPFYVGTGCVFNRTALYGFEPPLKPKHKKPALFSSCCGGSKSSNKGSDKKKSSKHVDPTVPIFSLEDIDEGVEGAIHVEWRCSSICNSRDSPQMSCSCYQLRI